MNHLIFTDTMRQAYPVCFLVPYILKEDIQKSYLDPFGVDPDDVLVLSLSYDQSKKKTPMADMKRYIKEELAPVMMEAGVEYVMVADADYFKALTKAPKVEANLGYVMDTEYGPFKVIYVPNFKAIFYDPIKVKSKIRQGMKALVNHRAGTWTKPGANIIEFADYPQTDDEIEAWLVKLLEMDVPLAIDIEAFDLKHHKAGIGTITFCWSKTEGIAFAVDYAKIDGATKAPFGMNIRNEHRRAMLKAFFMQLKQKAIYHRISYDVYVLIYQLFMSDILDTEGMLEGIEIMLRNWDDTKLIAYLATNSCSGNKLSLKDQAQEYAGNYAMDSIEDITLIPLEELLEYNLVDGLSTWFTHEKNYDKMIADQQLDIYETLFKPATVDIIQMQLTGMPINMKRVAEVKAELQQDFDQAMAAMRGSATIQRYHYKQAEDWVNAKNASYKKKRVVLADYNDQFNPNSPNQLQDLLFDFLKLPILSLTDSKQPSTDGDTLKALVNHTADKDVLAFLKGLIDFKLVDKMLTSFIPAMENAALGPDGWHYLFGNFNLGGTVSGRLSSSEPNLQNLPANGKKGQKNYAKLIKSCFEAPPGWLFAGLDFASLEDRISAVTTRDPNKLKVYTDGYDGHCLRSFSYFREEMPDIVETVASINSIEKKYKEQRQDSKAPTFALTYQGTYITLMKNCGFPQDKAMKIENRYRDLYKVSIDWVSAKLDQACKDGYITAAFGLRVRTPLLHQVIRGTSKTPFEAEAEGRTAGNALGQSWCLLNSRASAEFMGKVRASEYRLDIRPCAHIHDAQYMLVRDDIKVISFTNKHLVEAVQWQDHPDIANDDVKLGGEFGIFYPNWTNEITIPNGATEEQIFDVIDAAMASL